MSKRSHVEAGDRYGRLTVIEEVEPRIYAARRRRRRRFKCQCECGETTIVDMPNLRNGHTSSCGCLQRESRYLATSTHGKRHTRTYKSWATMKQRCLNPQNAKYPRYGGRGITVCDRWKESFEAFLEDMGECPDERTIDRINNDLGYFKNNCRWATGIEQQRNKGTNAHLTFQGRTMCNAAWAEEVGLSAATLWRRINNLGFTVEEALTLPVMPVGARRTQK